MTTASSLSPAPNRAAAPEMVLIFRLSGEAFAISVSWVHEILDPIPMTTVPNAAAYVPALVNVRGAIVPLIDIRHRLRMPPVTPGPASRLVVLELPVAGVPTRLAIMTDAVEEVTETGLEALEPVPDLGARWPEHYVRGVVRIGDDLAILLETENLFCPDAERPALA